MPPEALAALYFVSSSRNKFEDYQFLLGKYADLHWSRQILEEPLTVSMDLAIRRKMEAVRPLLPHLPFVVEQTGLIIKAWKGLPGNLTGVFMDTVGNLGICRMMSALTGIEERAAVAITDLGYHSPEGRVSVFRGELSGRIADSPQGDRGFGWDAIFIPEGHDETFGEMSLEKKNSISTRMLAVTRFYDSVLDHSQAGKVAQNRILLQRLILRHFNKTELEDLCFGMGIDPEEVLPDSVKREQVRELILYCDRHARVPDLLTACQLERPNVEWPDFA